MSNIHRYAVALVVLLAMIATFWWPALVGGKTIFHGDSMVHGLPLLELHSAALQGKDSVLWSNKIYGGHPIFAETQGAFAQPLNILLAWLVPPVYGHNLFHFICMLISGVGTFGLCRSLGIGVWSSGFGALTVVFATLWTGSQQNLSISGALSWVPFLFWSVEAWLKRPSGSRAIALAVTAAFVVFGGYPQVLHGAIIYILISLLPTLLSAQGRVLWQSSKARLMLTGLAAAILAIGLSAVQWLPLIELIRSSHRNSGIGLFWPIIIPEPYYRGLLFTFDDPGIGTDIFFPSLGSLLVPVIASMIFMVRTADRVNGHVLAAVFLFQLGMGPASPIFNLVYNAHAVPGLHFFRTTAVYLAVAVLGVAVVSAWVIDSMAKGLTVSKLKLLILGAALVVFWLLIWKWLSAPSVRYIHFAFVVLSICVMICLSALGRRTLIPLFLFVLFCIECADLRMRPFAFVDPELLREPPARSSLLHAKDISEYKFLDISWAGGYGLRHPLSPGQAKDMQRMLSAISPMSNLRWGVASMNGALALQTQRRALIEPLLQNEIRNQSPLAAGQRLIDVLGVRFITAESPLEAPGFRLVQQDDENHLWITENTSALPRFQTYTRVAIVQSVEQAKSYFEAEHPVELIVEDWHGLARFDNENINDANAIKITDVEKAKSTDYILNVVAEKSGWLFLADVNYPGWAASIDGQATHVFSANILGKAVQIPPGAHRVEIQFKPYSFYLGLSVTLLSLVAIVIYFLWDLAPHFLPRVKQR